MDTLVTRTVPHNTKHFRVEPSPKTHMGTIRIVREPNHSVTVFVSTTVMNRNTKQVVV